MTPLLHYLQGNRVPKQTLLGAGTREDTMGQALANRLPKTGDVVYSRAQALAWTGGADRKWSARQSLTFVAAASALLWMLLLETARVL